MSMRVSEKEIKLTKNITIYHAPRSIGYLSIIKIKDKPICHYWGKPEIGTDNIVHFINPINGDYIGYFDYTNMPMFIGDDR